MSPIISLQISDDLHERFEKTRNASGFPSKSDALRDAIVKFIENYEKFENLEGYKIMTINLVYPFKDNINDALSDVYSQFYAIIKTASDWRIAEKKIEILLVIGEFGLIKDLLSEISKIKEIVCSAHEIIIE